MKRLQSILLSGFLFPMFVCVVTSAADVSVTTFGITGAGDESTKLQTAFDSVAGTGNTLTIPADMTITVTQNMFLHGSCSIRGLGVNNSSTIQCDADLANDWGRAYWLCLGISNHKNDGGVQDAFNGTISNLCVKASSNAKFSRGIFIFNTSNLTISNVLFDYRSGTSNVNECLFGATSSGNNSNWEPQGAKTISNITVTGCTIVANHRYTDSEGIGIGNASNVTISHNFIYGVGDDPIGCHFIDGLTITNNFCYSIDGRILTNNCTDVEVSNNYCERIPEFGTTWYGGGSMTMAGLEGNNNCPAPENLLIKDNVIVIPNQTTAYTYGIRILGGRTVTIDSNIIQMNSPNGGGCIRIEADTAYPSWTDPDGIDADHIARPRNITITNNLLNGLYPGGIQQTGVATTLPGPFNVSCNVSGSYLWYTSANTFIYNSNIIANENYSTSGVALYSIYDPVTIYSDTLSNVRPSQTVTGSTYTAILSGRASGYSISLTPAVTTGSISLELWKNGTKVATTTGITGSGGTYALNYSNPDFAFTPGNTLVLKAVGLSSLAPSTGIAMTVNVKGLTSTVAADYKFDNGGSSDYSGNGNNGTIYGADTVAGIACGNALAFSGSDYVSVTDHNSLDISDKLAVSFWINSSTVPSGYAAYPIRKGSSSTDTNYVCYYFGDTAGAEAGKIGFLAKTSAYGGGLLNISARYALPLNQWVHVALSYNSTSGGQLYINGIPCSSRTGSGILNTNTIDFKIGSGFNGILDEVKIFNRELTADEITNLYSQVNHGQITSHWKFNEGTGGTAGDSSGSGLEGAITGAAWSTGVNGGALTFDGNDYLTVADDNKLDIYDKLTVSFWINASAYPSGYAGYPIKKNSNTTDANFVCHYFGTTAGAYQGKIGFLANAGGAWKAISQYETIPQNQWVHVALTYNSTGGGQLYLNGIATGSRTGSGTLAVNAADLIIGTAIKGKLDEVSIYNRELSADEIRGIYYINK